MPHFIDNGDNTITDSRTGLIWQKNTLAVDVNSAAADEAIAALGEGWRRPTVTELFGLVDHTKHDPAIDTDFFPDTHSDCYWTDTPCAWNDAAVWVVGFGFGFVGHYYRHYGYACVRAVRSSQ